MSSTTAAGFSQKVGTGVKERRPPRVRKEDGTTVLEMKSMRREGDQLVINGTLMGAWPSDMYVDAKDIAHMIRIAVTPAVIGLIVSLPYILWRDRRKEG